MCLLTSQMQPQTALKDIVVYKLLTVDLNSPFFDYEYTLNALNKTTMRTSLCYLYLEVNEGFHSYSSVNEAENHKRMTEDCTCRMLKIYEAVIPAGSLYYFDHKDGEYASNQLIITKLHSYVPNNKTEGTLNS